MKYNKHGVFYLLPLTDQKDNEFSFITRFTCNLTKIQWRLGKSILIACENKFQATQIDEALWKLDQDSFLPHNLFGKNAHNTPIIVYWAQCCYDNIPRDLLINLMSKPMNFFFNFNEIIDFVPAENILKKLARIRYKSYKDIGFKLHILDVSNCISN